MAEPTPVTLTLDPLPRNVERPKGNVARWTERKWKWEEGSLLGAAEVAAHLGISRQRISQLKADDPTFPPSGITSFRTPLWRRAAIQAWAAMHRPAKVEAGGRFFGEAAALLLQAEQAARDAGHWWLEAGHLWAVACDAAAGEQVARTLSSMGIVRAEVTAYLELLKGTDTRPRHTLGMNPRFQGFLVAADKRAEKAGRDRVSMFDMLLAFLDAPPQPSPYGRKQLGENFLNYVGRRGLDVDELRRRLLALEADPSLAATFDSRTLRRARPRTARKLMPGVALASNPLGHDPRTRTTWGSVFGRTRDGRSLVLNGEQWFFATDGDGFYVRSADGRPVGYRWRIRPKPRKRPTNGFLEVLPIPPVELADWPDRRFGPEDEKPEARGPKKGHARR